MAEPEHVSVIRHESGKPSVMNDLKEIPSWVWLGAVAAGALLFFLTRGRSGTVTGTATPTDTSATQAPTTGGMSPYDVYRLVNEMNATGTQVQPVTLATPTPQHAIYMDANPGGFGHGNPIVPTPGGAALTPQQQQMMGPYGGDVVQTSNPFANIPGWAGVTTTTYTGGGALINLGTAQPAPQPGQVIPPAVQDQVIYNPDGTPNWAATVQGAYNYPQGFYPGMTQ